MLAMWGMQSAWGCGGFFCDQVQPIEQSAERILFREDGPQDWTTIVEVQFRGPPAEFGWVIPLPRPLDPQTEISLAPAGLFDALEQVTGPQFLSSASPSGYYAESSAGCDAGCGPSTSLAPDTSGVQVVGEAVVGPYDLEVIEATESDNLVSWLQLAGYQVPFSAVPIVEQYLAEGYVFLGVKLLPDVPEGPIDALVLRCGAEQPAIPLRLTSVAAVPDMEILAYVLASERHVPGPGYAAVQLDPSLLLPGGDNYAEVLGEALDAAGGRGFRTEFAGPTAPLVAQLPDEVQQALGHGAYLSRMRAYLSASEMTLDPVFVPDPEAGDVDRVLWVGAGASASAGGLGLLVLLAGAGLRRRAWPG
jgi:hypothetical protein